MSGYSNQVPDDQLAEAGFIKCISKPLLHERFVKCLLDIVEHERDDATAPPNNDNKALPTETHCAQMALNILLVEDNPINQKVATRQLKKLGHDVEIANNGLEAFEILERYTYDLILMGLPNADNGWLRSHP